FEIRFFVFDKSNKSVERVLKLRVDDTEDLSKKDAENYQTYRDILEEALDLLDQLEENQKGLEKELKKAKKGKVTRAIVSASFGAITGVSPLLTNPKASKAMGAIGGTTTMTLGTVEATVIGAAISTVNEKMKINIELRSQFLSEGSSFSRRYNSKANRRNQNYSYDIEKMRTILNSPKISTLELDAGWENKKKVNTKRLKMTFADFDTNDN
ncbi:MAG: hypothetical protein OEY51_09040, partial [Cyclobacteriaceae bacterium]|nr:hypothetical protein [Cyclobacteriaceae bacterium]